MTAKEYLSEIQMLDKNIETKEDELARLWSAATSTTSPADREPGGGGITDKVGNNATKIADSKLREEIAALKADRQKRIDLIYTIKNPLQFIVLYKHYVCHEKLVDIAEQERYSYQYIVEIHSETIKRLKF